MNELRRDVERLAGMDEPPRDEAREALGRLLDALEAGQVRAAEPTTDGWRAVDWVKRGILLGFRLGVNRSSHVPPVFHFRDRDTFPTLDPERLGGDVRIVPGGVPSYANNTSKL